MTTSNEDYIRKLAEEALGYRDENGRPVRVEWPEFTGRELETRPLTADHGNFLQPHSPPSREQIVAEITAAAATIEPETSAAKVNDFMDLVDGEGTWNGDDFTLGAKELAAVHRIIVGAMQRRLREKVRALRKMVGKK